MLDGYWTWVRKGTNLPSLGVSLIFVLLKKIGYGGCHSIMVLINGNS